MATVRSTRRAGDGSKTKHGMIVSCGEALIDFIPIRAEDGEWAYRPAAGGSPYNVALALGRLGAEAGFMGGLSTDFFGTLLLGALEESKVDLSHTVRTDRPTVLAFVSFGNGEPQYAFYDEGSAARLFDPAEARPIGLEVECLHAGSISLIGEPAASNIERLFLADAGRRVLSIDPNVRPSLVCNEPAYRPRLDRMLGAADIVKVSRADLDWLAPGRDPSEWARARIERGTALVVLTAGSEGARAITASLDVRQPAVPVKVVDTVGAGDAFTAGLLRALQNRGLLRRGALGSISEPDLRAALEFAARIAALTCTRAGADPPWADELLSYRF
jgi:fructokinase